MKNAFEGGDGGRGRLLIIDGDPVQAAIIGRVAAEAGYDAVAVASVEEAELAFGAIAFDCIALDLGLEGRDAVETLRALARRGRKTPVVVIGVCEPHMLNILLNASASLGLNIVAMLGKPISHDELRQAVAPYAGNVDPARREARSGQMEADQIRDAITGGDIYLEFLPKMALANGHVYGCDAAAHWLSPRDGYVGSAALHATAKRFGLAPALSEVILRQTLRQGRAIAQSRPDFTIAVDVTDFVTGDADAPAKLGEIARAADGSLGFLTLAVQQQALAQADGILDALVRLRVHGVGIALQDFGGTAMSLAALARRPFGEAVIDAHFVATMVERSEARKIVRAAIAVANELGMLSVAAGVDQPRMVPLLQEAGCWAAKGLAIATPVSLSQMPLAIDPWKATGAPASPSSANRRAAT
jgi:EAL domain-containing protein (putative c-di-GMP-specific phosphodiesterase class I)